MSDRTPSRASRMFAAFLVARAAYGLGYLGVSLAKWPVPWYFPIERRWEITAAPSGFAMGWYGATLAAIVLSSMGFAITWIASARGPLARALTRTSIITAIAHAGALVLLVDFVYFGWTLTHQVPSPLPEAP